MQIHNNTLIAECSAYDFKEMLERKKVKSWLKSVSAFANTDGGSLFYGVNDDRREHEHIQIERISREQLFQHIQRFQHRKIRQMQTIVIIHNNQTAVTLQTAHSKKMHCFIIHTH